MSDDLITFLRARLDEDEAVARAATDGPWRATHRADGTHHVLGGAVVGEWTSSRKVHRDGGYPADWPKDVVDPAADAEHIARHDPARILAEVTAKRDIVEAYERSLKNNRTHPGDLATAGALLARLGAVKAIAAPYNSHPDYRPEWASAGD